MVLGRCRYITVRYQTVQLRNGAFQNGTLHNGTFQSYKALKTVRSKNRYGTLLKGKVTERYV
jgi:hypothetical protein